MTRMRISIVVAALTLHAAVAGAAPGARAKPAETDVTRGETAQFSGDKDGAVKLYKKACAAKVPGGCGHLAMMAYEGGGGIAKNVPLAQKQLEELCDANDGYSCYAQAILFENVPGADGKYRPADELIALYDKGCTLKSTDACNALGMLYHSGRSGAPKDDVKAAAALKRGCELGDRMSCMQIPMLKEK